MAVRDQAVHPVRNDGHAMVEQDGKMDEVGSLKVQFQGEVLLDGLDPRVDPPILIRAGDRASKRADGRRFVRALEDGDAAETPFDRVVEHFPSDPRARKEHPKAGLVLRRDELHHLIDMPDHEP